MTAGPEGPDSHPDVTHVTDSLDDVRVRAAATGDHALLLEDAGARIEAVTALLAHAALEMDSQVLDGMVRLLDRAGREIAEAVEP